MTSFSITSLKLISCNSYTTCAIIKIILNIKIISLNGCATNNNTTGIPDIYILCLSSAKWVNAIKLPSF